MLRRKEKKSIAIPLFIIAVMVLSALGYAVFQGGNSNLITYNGFKFTKIQDKFWRTKVNGVGYDFYFSPEDLQNIPSQKFNLPSFVYLTSDPNANYSKNVLATIEVAKFELKNALTAKGYNVAMNFSSQVTCKDATPSTGVVDLSIGNETIVEVQGTCVLVKGTSAQELVAARDKFMMHVLGVY